MKMIGKYKNYVPQIHEHTFIAPSADVIGEVVIEDGVTVWYGTAIRGDCGKISIGKGSNVQDNSVLHTTLFGEEVVIGENVTVGHGAILHSCKINNNCIIGMGSIILDGAEIGENTIVAAGSIVTGNKKIPSGVMCMGSPAKVVRELTEAEINHIELNAKHYTSLIEDYKEESNG